MTNLLAGLTDLSGFRGAGLFNGAGECLEHQLEAPYDAFLVSSVLGDIRLGLEPFRHLAEARFERLIVGTAKGCLMIDRRDGHIVIVMGSSQLRAVMVRVAVGGIFRRLESGETPALESRPAEPTVVAPSQILEPASRGSLRKTLEALIEQLGPFGQIIWKQELEQIGAHSNSIERSQFSEFIGQLASRISDLEKRQEFTATVSRLEP